MISPAELFRVPGGAGELAVWTLDVNLAVPGKPRMTQRDKWAKRPEVMRYRWWCELMRIEMNENPPPPAGRVITLNWMAQYAIAESISKRRRAAMLNTLHRSKPDRDNIDKAILDCLYPSGDQAIAAGFVSKIWGPADRITVVIHSQA